MERPPLSLSRGADIGGLVMLAVTGIVFGVMFALTGAAPIDARMYWDVGHSATYYGSTWGVDGAFYLYPPPLAQVVGLLPSWPVFIAVLMAALFVALWLSLREWSLPIVAIGLVSVWAGGYGHALAQPLQFALIGNIHSLLIAAIVVGFRWPAAWAFVLLTKIGPGVGLLWFAFRGEWRAFAIALGTTAAVALGSFLLAPDAWSDFLRFAVANAGTDAPIPVLSIPLPIRVAMSVGLLWWGARTDRRWVVPIAAGWSSLALYQWSWVPFAFAALPLVRRR